jgi:hypothetical protein
MNFDIALGDLPTWIGLGSAVAALFTYISSRRDSKRTPASSVFVTCSDGRGDDPDIRTITVHNGSAFPITDVTISSWSSAPNQKGKWWWNLLRMDVSDDFSKPHRFLWHILKWWNWIWGWKLQHWYWYSVGPGESRQVNLLVETSAKRLAPQLMLMFRDGSGRAWVRWPNGRLSRKRALRSGEGKSEPRRSAFWAEDPWANHRWRYWNGYEWTDSVADDGQQTKTASLPPEEKRERCPTKDTRARPEPGGSDPGPSSAASGALQTLDSLYHRIRSGICSGARPGRSDQ